MLYIYDIAMAVIFLVTGNPEPTPPPVVEQVVVLEEGDHPVTPEVAETVQEIMEAVDPILPAPVVEETVEAVSEPVSNGVLCSHPELGEGSLSYSECPEGWQHVADNPPLTWEPHVVPEGEIVLCTLPGNFGQNTMVREDCVASGGTPG